jgi:hypothetical protein
VGFSTAVMDGPQYLKWRFLASVYRLTEPLLGANPNFQTVSLGISVHNVAVGLGAVEIFFILVVVALVGYVVWRLVVRPRR